MAVARILRDTDIIGLSSHSRASPLHVRAVKEKGVETPVIVGWSIITPADSEELYKMGVAGVFGASSTNQEIIDAVKRLTPDRK